MAETLGANDAAEVWKDRKQANKVKGADVKSKGLAKMPAKAKQVHTPMSKKKLNFEEEPEEDEEEVVDWATMLESKVKFLTSKVEYLFKLLYTRLCVGIQIVVDKELFKLWFGQLIDVDMRIRDRLFIIQVLIERFPHFCAKLFKSNSDVVLQVAAEDGWSVAKSVALRKEGKWKDAEYQKVLELKLKEAQEDKKKEKERAAKRPRMPGFRPFGGAFNPQGGFPNPWQMQFPFPNPGQFGQFAPAQSPTQKRTAGPNSSCFNCQALGHFARDCPSKPGGPGPAHK